MNGRVGRIRILQIFGKAHLLQNNTTIVKHYHGRDMHNDLNVEIKYFGEMTINYFHKYQSSN